MRRECDWGGSGREIEADQIRSKFFSQANGTKAKPAPSQQTTLSFSTKAAIKKKQDDETAAVREEEVETTKAEIKKSESESDEGALVEGPWMCAPVVG